MKDVSHSKAHYSEIDAYGNETGETD